MSSCEEIFIAGHSAAFGPRTCVLETRPVVGQRRRFAPALSARNRWRREDDSRPRYNDAMHVYSYKLKLEPMLWHPTELTSEALAERLASDALIHEFASRSSG